MLFDAFRRQEHKSPVAVYGLMA